MLITHLAKASKSMLNQSRSRLLVQETQLVKLSQEITAGNFFVLNNQFKLPQLQSNLSSFSEEQNQMIFLLIDILKQQKKKIDEKEQEEQEDKEAAKEENSDTDKDDDDNDDDDDDHSGGLLMPLYEVIKGIFPRLIKPNPKPQE